ncbi:dihydropteroate synthase [Gloeocapsa sp. PCC 73106]|uniref:dihydropteroate synthase n=1 Tax=Gloeocapsa sp. PCC 73106 TaxID=102232 RepID=UPI0002ABC3D9|nr:dihydropteroate synthase [Gloeocapsa sp. PCC 73106]ELR96894.1 dihydropteroate synthase [Gloeocapsa sp. PCC 73106]
MGVLNVTPDSFSDGGEFNTIDRALSQAEKMVASGADIIDVGGQSTRPGAQVIEMEEELQRVIPIVRALRDFVTVPISVDTTRAVVAQRSVEVGADLINDVSGGIFDPEMLTMVAQLKVPMILMHMRGTPANMQQLTQYEHLIEEIGEFFKERITTAVATGIDRSHIIIDPGLGFAKTYTQNLKILRDLSQFSQLQAPILVGPSRKSFIGQILAKSDPKERVWGTAAACCGAIASGADILRVHDLAAMYDVCRVADAIWRVN